MKQKIVIADADETFRTELAAALEGHDAFEVVGIAADGEEAVQIVRKLQPDMLVMDILLAKYDGLTVLQSIRDKYYRPRILIATAFISNYVAVSAVRLGAQQLIYKPCDIGVVIRNLYRIVESKNYGPAVFLWNEEKTIESLVTNILHDIGVPAHIKGYQYLREAIILASKDEDNSNAILKCRYREVADIFETTPQRVEHAIRQAIEVAWDRGDLDTLFGYFGYTVSDTKGKPTNSEFISIVADRIRLRLKDRSDID